MKDKIETLQTNHRQLHSALLLLPNVIKILGGGAANFLLCQIGTEGVPDNVRAEKVYTLMAERDKVVVRFRGREVGCEGCLRVTVGTKEECDRVVERLGVLLNEE